MEKPSVLLSAMTLMLSLAGSGAPAAAAQPARVTAESGTDLRAAYATSLDVAEGKRVAQGSCARCHGLNGISTTSGIPHLAGQRAVYLYRELHAFQSGTRPDETMQGVLKFLSDAALVNVASYYASLDPPQPAAPRGGKANTKPDAVAAGRAAAAGCSGCHGEAGVSKTPGMPNLAGNDPKYLVSAMKAYQGGQRKNDMMKSLLAALSDADMNNIALYYALGKPDRAKTPAAGDAAAGKAVAAACSGCHGEQGVSENPANPSLAGQDAQYLASALRAYKDGGRSDATMKGLAAALDDAAIRNVAAYYAAQQPQPPKVRKPLTTEEWAARCDRCHGVNGNSTEPQLPALAAQRADYLEKVLKQYRSGVHKSAAMSAMSSMLTEADVENLAAHYSRQKARAVVYVMLPAK